VAKVEGNVIEIDGEIIPPGKRRIIELPIPNFYSAQSSLNMTVHVVNGVRPGPKLFVSAALHGDEINGVAIIRRLLKHSALKRLRGTLIAIPIVNVFGIIQHSRYLPDRRDLNRAFPGSPTGSLAARVAHIFHKEIVEKSTHGIDFHTAANHRDNLPQIRANLENPETRRLAEAFGVPVILNSQIRDGSLRGAASDVGMPMLLYEAGEALRFDELSIRAGVRGTLSVMRELDMLPRSRKTRRIEPFVANSSAWVRAPASGVMHNAARLGSRVKKDQTIGVITDPSNMFDETGVNVTVPYSGLVIGRTNLPLVNEGDALFHIARFEDSIEVASQVEVFQAEDAGLDVLDPPKI